MANPFAATITLSSVGVTAPLMLDPTAKVTTVIVSIANTSAADLTVQGTVWSPGSNGTQQWAAVSSHFSTTGAALPDGAFLSVLAPIAGLRLSSTALTGGSATMQVIQAITA
jgi:hypothetical protein